MRHTVFLAFLIALIVTPLAAQGGYLKPFSDPAASDCGIDDTVVGVKVVYIFHVNTTGATGVQFSAPNPPCSQMTWVSDQPEFPITFGDSQSGVAVGYGTCRTGTFLIMSIYFLGNGTTSPCCYYPVMPDTREPADMIGVDCNYDKYSLSSGSAIINPTVNCQCAVPTEESSWGRIKSLY